MSDTYGGKKIVFYNLSNVSKGASPVAAVYSLCIYLFMSLDNLFSLICPDQKKLNGKPIILMLLSSEIVISKIIQQFNWKIFVYYNLQGRLSGMFANMEEKNMEAYWPK